MWSRRLAVLGGICWAALSAAKTPVWVKPIPTVTWCPRGSLAQSAPAGGCMSQGLHLLVTPFIDVFCTHPARGVRQDLAWAVPGRGPRPSPLPYRETWLPVLRGQDMRGTAAYGQLVLISALSPVRSPASIFLVSCGHWTGTGLYRCELCDASSVRWYVWPGRPASLQLHSCLLGGDNPWGAVHIMTGHF